jgi:uncharacterized membrane protein
MLFLSNSIRMQSILLDLILICLGLTGFFLARHIYAKKNKKVPLICPLRSNCDLVVTSKYSKILGVPVEILGMCYYASIVVLHLVMIAHPAFESALIAGISMAVSTCAFLFSLYLISIQAFVLKQWCTWCLCSAFLCVAIFFATYLGVPTIFF